MPQHIVARLLSFQVQSHITPTLEFVSDHVNWDE